MSRNLFYLNKSERRVLLWFVGLCCCVLLFFCFNGKEEMPTPNDTRDTLNHAHSARRNHADHSGPGKHDQSEGSHYQNYQSQRNTFHSTKNQNISEARLHPFDLNRAGEAELARLGFSERQIASVMKYRAKGGIYRHPEQMSKISGMTKGQYDKLYPYFTVADEFKPASDFVSIPKTDFKGNQTDLKGSQTDFKGNQTDLKGSQTDLKGNGFQRNAAPTSSPSEAAFPEKLKPGEKIALNSADTTLLKKIPGIGSVRAAQIVKYRERLGGFHSLDQLNALQNIPAYVQEHLMLDAVPLRKIRINHLSVNQLVQHPYISFFQAKAICDYRRQKGRINSLDELKPDKNFTADAIRRLKPYIEYD